MQPGSANLILLQKRDNLNIFSSLQILNIGMENLSEKDFRRILTVNGN